MVYLRVDIGYLYCIECLKLIFVFWFLKCIKLCVWILDWMVYFRRVCVIGICCGVYVGVLFLFFYVFVDKFGGFVVLVFVE